MTHFTKVTPKDICYLEILKHYTDKYGTQSHRQFINSIDNFAGNWGKLTNRQRNKIQNLVLFLMYKSRLYN